MSTFSMLLLVGTSLNCPVPATPVPAPSTAAMAAHQPTLMEQAGDQVCQTLAGRFASTTLTLLSTGNVADEKLHARLPASVLPGELRNGRLPVTLKWDAARGLRQKTVLWFRVAGIGKAWQFQRDLPADRTVSAADVERVEVDLAALGMTRELAEQNPVGLAVVKPVRRGQIANGDVLRQPALVSRNERVRVVLAQRGLRIVTRGTALTTGWNQNDPVQVDIAESERTILAKVAGKDEVYVEM